MKRVLVLGAEGIAGQAIMRALPDARGTTRAPSSNDRRIRANIDITMQGDLEAVFDRIQPDVVINCAGIVKSECDKHDPAYVHKVNAEAPHVIAMACPIGCRVIHLSTDCVYDGTRGNRTETEATDATDWYGQTKAAGELKSSHHCVTLRTSFIGRDPKRGRGLLEWLLDQQRINQSAWEVTGYVNALWSGLSAPELARVIVRVATDPTLANLCGVYHVSGPIISKADLLSMLIGMYQLPCWVRREDEPRIDRTLDDARFRAVANYVAPSWIEMAKELAADGA